MTLSAEENQLIESEQQIVREVLASLEEQYKNDCNKFGQEKERARDLTSAIVNTRRVEDKAMLASDEAVAHGLTIKKKEDVAVLERLIARPYFGRIVLEEETPTGTKTIEYKLGLAANPDCRIVDWRKAPIAKLFYEFKEGDEYSEEILGRERTGRVVLRRTVEIEGGELKKLVSSNGSFERNGESWVKTQTFSAPKKTGGIPDVLSLISAEQFRAITEEATSAVLVQGVAGSGKTTIALYRLAWLLHHENSDLKPHEAIVVVLSPALRAYVKNCLPALGIEGVRILTFSEFALETLRDHVPPQFLDASKQIRRPDAPTPRAIRRAKGSMAMLTAIEQFAANYAQRSTWTSYTDDLLNVLSRAEEIVRHDSSKLLDRELIIESFKTTKANFEAGVLGYEDDALLMRLIEIKTSGVSVRNQGTGRYRHIVIDEVQDLNAPQLASLVGAAKDSSCLTVVGDAHQIIDAQHTFPGWDLLRTHWAFKDSVSKFLTLSVSHRSTLPIMKLADFVLQRDLVNDGRPGRVPLWLHCRNEARGIDEARNWLSKAQERFPSDLSAVVCATKEDAKFALSVLSPTFGSSIRMADEGNFTFDQGIVVTTVRAVKGLEFTNVQIWNPTPKNYPDDSASRNALYVAISRAQENLSLVSWQKTTPILPPHSSPLVRGMRMGFSEVES